MGKMELARTAQTREDLGPAKDTATPTCWGACGCHPYDLLTAGATASASLTRLLLLRLAPEKLDPPQNPATSDPPLSASAVLMSWGDLLAAFSWEPRPQPHLLRQMFCCCPAACTLHVLVPDTATDPCPYPRLLGAVCCAARPRVQSPGWNVALPLPSNYPQFRPKSRA